jgi:hypothetical protein
MASSRNALRFAGLATASSLVACASSNPVGTSDAAIDHRQSIEEHDASPEAEASGPPQVDAGADASHACVPGSLAGFEPAYMTPVGPYANACTVAQLTDAVDACFGPSSSASACNDWVDASANLGCLNCWSGPETNLIWTPILYAVHGGQEVEIDTGGCIALADPSELACAKSVEAIQQCELAACLPSCIIPSDDDLTAITKCTSEANMGECLKYAEAAAACESALGAGPAAFCLDAFMSAADLIDFFALSCGPKPSDGGSSPLDGGAG